MLALRVEYLTGVCMATKHDDPARSKPEWPPHPDRLFSALIAAAAEPEPCNFPDSAKRAFEWLIKQGPPDLHASHAFPRTAPTVFMPSNPHEEESRRKGGPKDLLPIYRQKVGLPIPAVVPDKPVVYFMWPNAEPDEYADTLRAICDRVSYIGRSRSLVRVTLEDQAPAATHVPDPAGDLQLRVPQEGRLKYLLDKYARDGGKPEPSPPRRYRQGNTVSVESKGPPSLFNRFWVFRPLPGDPVLSVETALHITQSFRKAVLKKIHEVTCVCERWNNGVPSCRDAPECYAKIPGVLSGYAPDCSPIRKPHPAFLALPFVHHAQRHADGAVKGLAVLIPRDMDHNALSILAKALVRIEGNGVKIPGVGTWHLTEAPADEPSLATLERKSWQKPSRRWTTVTPMVFGRFPKLRNGGEVSVILDSMRLAGIDVSNVVEIATDRHALLYGAPPSWRFRTRLTREGKAKPERWVRHVTVQFDRPVSGPLVIGALRYFGLGLMKPLEPNDA